MDRESVTPGEPNIEKKGPKSGFSVRKPAGDLAPTCPDHLVSLPARKNDIQPSSLTIFILFSNKKTKQKHENQAFRASLKPQGPRDLPCVKEREIKFRIALTRALYDQMAPQLCYATFTFQENSEVSQVFCWRFGPLFESLETPSG